MGEAKRADSASALPREAPASDRSLEAISGYLADAETASFDRLVSGRIRIGMLSALAVQPVMAFTELRRLLDTSDGNLSVHARKLEEAGYVRCEKRFEGRQPRTEYSLTDAGRLALDRYLSHMESLIEATRPR